MKNLIKSSLVAALLPLSAFATDYTFTTNTWSLRDFDHGHAVTWGLNNTNGVNNTTNSTTTAYSNLFSDINGGGKVVTGAKLTLYNIWDWQGEAPNQDPADALFINLLSGLYSANTSGIKEKEFDASSPNADLNWTNAINPFVNNNSSTSWNYKLQYTGTPLIFNDATTGSLLKAAAGDTKTGTPAGVTWSDPQGGAARNFNLVINLSAENLAAFTSLLDGDGSNGSPNVGLGFAAECHYYMDSVKLEITTGTATVPDSGSTIALMGLGLAALVGFRRSRK